MHTKFGSELNVRYHLRDLDLDGKVILELISKKCGVNVINGFTWDQDRVLRWNFVNSVMNIFHSRRRIPSLTERILNSLRRNLVYGVSFVIFMFFALKTDIINVGEIIGQRVNRK
jgi:hypothetical protein